MCLCCFHLQSCTSRVIVPVDSGRLNRQIKISGIEADLMRGQLVFKTHCQKCHKADGKGRNKPDYVNFPREDSPLFKTNEASIGSIKNGVTDTSMKAWNEELSQEQIVNVLGYLRAAFGVK
jgi:mono/diheme cytochrome c family protein